MRCRKRSPCWASVLRTRSTSMMSMPTAMLTPCGGWKEAASASGSAEGQAERRLLGEDTCRIAGGENRRRGAGAATDAAIDEALVLDLRTLIDVTSVDQHRAAHRAADHLHIQRLELVPFSYDDQGIRLLRDLVWTLAERHHIHMYAIARQCLAPGLARHRIVYADRRALGRDPADNVDRGSFAHIIGVGLEGEAEDADCAVAQRAEDICYLGDDQAALIVVDVHNGAQQLGM